MRREGEDLPITGSKAIEDLEEPDFTYNELLDALEGYFYEKRQPGDIDARQLAKRYKVTTAHALRMMEKIVREDPDWMVVKVMDGSRPPIKVLRRTRIEDQAGV
jgi:hypothetical protein